MAHGDTLKNAAIGAAVSLVLFFLPFSPAVGGAVAGYLQRGDGREGARVGGLSGLIAAVPGAALAVLAASLFVIVGPDAGASLLAFVVFFLVALLVGAVYGVALGAVGGFVGAYLADERGSGRTTRPQAGSAWGGDEREGTTDETAADGPTGGPDATDESRSDAGRETDR